MRPLSEATEKKPFLSLKIRNIRASRLEVAEDMLATATELEFDQAVIDSLCHFIQKLGGPIMRFFAVLFFILFPLVGQAQIEPPVIVAGVDELEWTDTNPEGVVRAYRMYIKETPGIQPGSDLYEVEIEAPETTWVVDTAPGPRKYFAVTAVGHNGEESGPSNELEGAVQLPEIQIEIPISWNVIVIGICDLVAVDEAVDFGDVEAEESIQRMVSVRNDGLADCTIASATVSGGGGALSVVNPPTFPATVAPTETLDFMLQLDAPTTTGAGTATFSIN